MAPSKDDGGSKYFTASVFSHLLSLADLGFVFFPAFISGLVHGYFLHALGMEVTQDAPRAKAVAQRFPEHLPDFRMKCLN